MGRVMEIKPVERIAHIRPELPKKDAYDERCRMRDKWEEKQEEEEEAVKFNRRDHGTY